MTKNENAVWSSPTPLFDLTGQDEMPYADAVKKHAEQNKINLMVPGHSGSNEAGAHAIADYFGDRIAALDIPLMIEGIDLGSESPMMQARRLAAAAWGAHKTWFLSNGASQANRTAAIAVAGLGKNVIMQRSSHSSFIDGVLAAGLKPSFISPSVDYKNGASHGVTPQALEEQLAAADEPVAAVYVVSPSYFGATADVAGIAEVAHRYGAALIVDGAWGPHFGFHEKLPESPVRLGADIVISSTHKLAGSLTQSAMLHLGKSEFTERLLPYMERAFSMTSSTSQSAILSVSLDIARHTLVNGRANIGKSIEIANDLRDRIRLHPHLAVLDDTFKEFDDIVATDPLRVAIDVSALAHDGHWVRGYLQTEHNIFFEMSTSTVIVAVIGAGARPSVERIMAALDDVVHAAGLRDGAHISEQFPELPAPSELVMLPRDAYFAEIELVSAAEAVGRISADSLAAYPPGIPNVLPGEIISKDLVEFLSAVATSPTGYVRGAHDSVVSKYRVVKR
ncbi:aminotransferase class I/II-fold pyridoxal phosphate-dependent enzyme [Canibacter zhoujuaniae]|uniref:aminotransferase class I/II-fold pyridoxal phosphate-dependent enzyme n=1 Tax=Canibacter zhoujuaniae TaxID=2708343 RepID=UPI001FB86898|nr:aminotransferase class V-fold PLP-dependent enzyme [Canibacter zhoujuaniae]